MSVKPFPPRTLTLGIPGLAYFHLHVNSTRQGLSKGWGFLGNRITWSRSRSGEYRLRKLATRQVKRDIKTAEGKLPSRDARDPRMSSSGSFGFDWIAKLSKNLRADPHYQWGLGEKAGAPHPITLEFLNKDPQGRYYDPQNPNADPFGNVISYGMDGQPIYGGPLMDPSMYGQYAPMPLPFGPYGPAYAQGPMMNSPNAGYFDSYGGFTPSPYPNITNAYDPTDSTNSSWPSTGDPRMNAIDRFGNSRFSGSRIRGAPPSLGNPGFNRSGAPPPDIVADRPTRDRPLSRGIELDPLF
jgi:hypothetical protein